MDFLWRALSEEFAWQRDPSGRPDPAAKTEKRTDKRIDDKTYLQEKAL